MKRIELYCDCDSDHISIHILPSLSFYKTNYSILIQFSWLIWTFEILFKDENIHDNPWKFFPYQTTFNENYLAVANWEHQYEWRNDLTLDFDKLNNCAPWIIKSWDKYSLKPLTEEFKSKYLEARFIEFLPKLKPWEESLDTQQYDNKFRYKETEIIDKAIEKILGSDYEVKNLRDIEDNLFKFKAYFRDLNLES